MTRENEIQALKDRIRDLEKQVHKSERAFEDLSREKLFSEKVLDSLPGIFYLYDEKGNLVRWNNRHETLTGFSKEELPGRKVLDWFSGEDKARVSETIRELFVQGGKRDMEAGLLIKDGSKIPYYFTGVSMVLEDRKYLLGVGVDLTEIKKVEEALKKSEEQYRAIFENAVEGIYQTTAQGELIRANPAMARMLGYDSPKELVQSVRDIQKLYVSRRNRDEVLRRISNDKVVSGLEIQLYKKQGGSMWASLHARAVLDEKGELALIEGLAADITEKKRATDELREREERLRKENIRLRGDIRDRYRFGDIIGKSPAMQEVYEVLLQAAATDANVIVYGESGTGKELAARTIHDMSDRKEMNFVTVNCGAIPENLVESEFFGYKKGAFTGANANKKGHLDIADKGTLFMDELGEIQPEMQVKLLRVLEGGGFTPVGGHELIKPDVRFIAATNRDLEQLVAQGKMREDFFYRVHIIPIRLPPLRDRIEDIPLIVEHFLQELFVNGKPPAVSVEMLEALQAHDWPGNVRELQNVLHRWVSLGQFDLRLAAGRAGAGLGRVLENSLEQRPRDFRAAMEWFEKKLFEKALEDNRWSRSAAAASLKLPQRTFFRKLKKIGLFRQK